LLTSDHVNFETQREIMQTSRGTTYAGVELQKLTEKSQLQHFNFLIHVNNKRVSIEQWLGMTSNICDKRQIRRCNENSDPSLLENIF